MSKNIKDALDLSKANWKDIKETAYDLVVVPWGAIEPHNYHLPYITDCYLSHNIALDSANLAYKKAGVMSAVYPPIFLGAQNPGQWDLPLCIHTNLETQKAIIDDMISSLRVQGIYKMVIINGHGGNSFKPIIRDMAKKYPDFFIVALNWFEVEETNSYFEMKPDEHGGEQETSVLMYYHPELVKLEQAGDGKLDPVALSTLEQKIAWAPRNWQKVSKDTGIGNPHKSTAEKGERYAKVVTEKISELLIELKDYVI